MTNSEPLSGSTNEQVVVTSNANEWQIYLMALLVLSGAITAFFPPATNTANAWYPHWVRLVWGAGLLLGGLINLLAIYMLKRDVLASIKLELVSTVVLGASTIIFFVITVFNIYHVPAMYRPGVTGFIIAPLIFVCIWRGIKLVRWHKQITKLRQLQAVANGD